LISPHRHPASIPIRLKRFLASGAPFTIFLAPLTFIEAFWPGSSAQSHAPRPPPLRGA